VVKDLEKIEIVNAILSKPKESLPAFLGIHPALDKRIHDTLKGNPEPLKHVRQSGRTLDTLIVTKEEIGDGEGLQIKIPGFKNNPESPDDGQIYIEHYEGMVQVHVWNGEEEYPTMQKSSAGDPVTVKIKPE